MRGGLVLLLRLLEHHHRLLGGLGFCFKHDLPRHLANPNKEGEAMVRFPRLGLVFGVERLRVQGLKGLGV